MNRLPACSRLSFGSFVAFTLLHSSVALAGLVNIPMVTVGDPGNPPDPATGSHYGAVNYVYNIGTYDVTAGQYTAFLNSVATSGDPNGLYSANMATGAGACGIIQTNVAGSYSYSVSAANQNFPVNFVSWGSAARFTNWLQNGEPSGPEGPSTTETGTYDLVAHLYPYTGATRSPTATYFLPNENEWYKAAYYAGGGTNAAYWLFPTQSNTAPINTLPDTGNHANFFDEYGTGNGGYTDPLNFLTPVGSFLNSPGAYGTYDMGGDVSQWTDTNVGSQRVFRGGSYNNFSDPLGSSGRSNGDTSVTFTGHGFRVASAPEPSTLVLVGVGALGLLTVARRRARVQHCA